MVKPLTPEQARRIVARACELWLAVPIKPRDGSPFYATAIDELTAKPGDKMFCEGCGWWHHSVVNMDWETKTVIWSQKAECKRPNFKPGHCPEGRWEDEEAD